MNGFKQKSAEADFKMDRSDPKEGFVPTISQLDIQDVELESKCPHGFESCMRFIQRFHYVYYDGRMRKFVWAEGDPEDELMFKIDKFEVGLRRLLKDPCENGYWLRYAIYGSGDHEQLQSMLIARLEEPGETYF